MMNQEEYMDAIALHRQGWTFKQIAERLDRHPATISKWVAHGGPSPTREFTGQRVVDDHWVRRIDELLMSNRDLLATSIYRILSVDGYSGSSPTLVRHVRAARGSRRERDPRVSVTITTAPGEEAQADWSDCSDWGRAWGIAEHLWCFGAILSWSRHRLWWFTTTADRAHTLEALVRFFGTVAACPWSSSIDRMGALGRTSGRAFRLHAPALDFARYHGFAFQPCRSGNARAKD
jgi:transposase